MGVLLHSPNYYVTAMTHAAALFSAGSIPLPKKKLSDFIAEKQLDLDIKFILIGHRTNLLLLFMDQLRN